ncbi:MAG TPA: alpha/beta hydrolase [Candidatus Acidoferrales bacterium]|nr:alpha/beta hydrolase [Candidatus Acidoferrales bacterium]
MILSLSAGHLVVCAQVQVPSNLYLLHVTVTDLASKPLVGAEILLDDELVGITDVTGQYYMARKPLPDGDHSVSASFIGLSTIARTVPRLAEISQSAAAPGVELTLKLPKSRGPMGAQYDGGAKAPPASYDIVPVFYVTDRQDTGNQNPALRYSGERSTNATVAYGMCEVTIPSTHMPGELESPSWLHFEYSPDPTKHIVLRSVEPLERDPFYAKLAAMVAASPTQEAIIFIHGYENSFESAARQTAQLVRDAHFPGAPIVYSWPSKNKVLAYTEDEDTVEWTTFHLREFLEEVAQRAHAKKIHLIAHSMGNRALASALQMIASRREPQAGAPFDQVILAAPDIGADTLTEFAKEIRPMAQRLTLYASQNDDALLLSRVIHGALRAGQKSAYLLVASGIDTVDASAVRTDFLGHAYYAKSGSIIDDIRKILTSEAPPELRNLIPASVQNLKYWIMPKLSPVPQSIAPVHSSALAR